MVVRVGLAPTVFLMWQIYSLLRSLLSHLTKNGSWAGIRTQDYRINSADGYHYRTHESKNSSNPYAAVSLATH